MVPPIALELPTSCGNACVFIAWSEYTCVVDKTCCFERKSMVVSLNFIELELLQHEDTWLTPIAVRSKIIEKVKGGFSHMMRLFLAVLLIGAEGLSTAGYPLVINGQTLLLYARWQLLVE